MVLERLLDLDVGGMVLLWWMCSCFSDRVQKVVLGKCCSNAWPLKYGTPQGLTFSAMLFNIYMNQLGEVVRGLGAGAALSSVCG